MQTDSGGRFEHDGRSYQMLFGSDIIADGVFLELSDWTTGHPEEVLFALYGDAEGQFTFTAPRHNLPFTLIENFVAQTRKRLPPSTL